MQDVTHLIGVAVAEGRCHHEPLRPMNRYVELSNESASSDVAAFGLLPSAFRFTWGRRTTVNIATPMPAPEWARLERRILADSVPAVKAFFAKYYDERGYFRHVVRWGANDGPDDAFENTTGWPELHALGASDEILQLHLRAWEGMLRQFTEAKTTDVPIGRQGMYYKDFSVQSDWMHHGEALRTSTCWRCRRRRCPPTRNGRGPMRRSTWGRIPTRRTTIRSARSSSR